MGDACLQWFARRLPYLTIGPSLAVDPLSGKMHLPGSRAPTIAICMNAVLFMGNGDYSVAHRPVNLATSQNGCSCIGRKQKWTCHARIRRQRAQAARLFWIWLFPKGLTPRSCHRSVMESPKQSASFSVPGRQPFWKKLTNLPSW